MIAMTATRTDDETEAALAALATNAAETETEMTAIADVEEAAEMITMTDVLLVVIDHVAAAQLGSLVEAPATTGSKEIYHSWINST